MKIEVKTHGERMIVDAHMIRCVAIWDEHERIHHRFFLAYGGGEIHFDLFAISEKAESTRFDAVNFIFSLAGHNDCCIGSLGGLHVESKSGDKSQHFDGEFRIVFRDKNRYLTRDETEYRRQLKKTDEMRKHQNTFGRVKA